jgi:prepilin-type N-terminal cleavage/methylation domain-containing protein
MSNRRAGQKPGFTLIELLVVIAIIAILASL